MIFDQFDIVVLPFPFTDRDSSKRRPAIIISHPGKIHLNRSLFAMITTSEHEEWPLDFNIMNLQEAGLSSPCKVRFKLFTIDHLFIIKKIGSLSLEDQEQLRNNLRLALNIS